MDPAQPDSDEPDVVFFAKGDVVDQVGRLLKDAGLTWSAGISAAPPSWLGCALVVNVPLGQGALRESVGAVAEVVERRPEDLLAPIVAFQHRLGTAVLDGAMRDGVLKALGELPGAFATLGARHLTWTRFRGSIGLSRAVANQAARGGSAPDRDRVVALR